jgi:hypothetical protein
MAAAVTAAGFLAGCQAEPDPFANPAGRVVHEETTWQWVPLRTTSTPPLPAPPGSHAAPAPARQATASTGPELGFPTTTMPLPLNDSTLSPVDPVTELQAAGGIYVLPAQPPATRPEDVNAVAAGGAATQPSSAAGSTTQPGLAEGNVYSTDEYVPQYVPYYVPQPIYIPEPVYIETPSTVIVQPEYLAYPVVSVYEPIWGFCPYWYPWPIFGGGFSHHRGDGHGHGHDHDHGHDHGRPPGGHPPGQGPQPPVVVLPKPPQTLPPTGGGFAGRQRNVLNGGLPSLDVIRRTQPVPPGTVQAGTLPPGTIQPGSVPPGTIQAGTVPPGTVHAGSIPPGTLQTGVTTPATVVTVPTHGLDPRVLNRQRNTFTPGPILTPTRVTTTTPPTVQARTLSGPVVMPSPASGMVPRPYWGQGTDPAVAVPNAPPKLTPTPTPAPTLVQSNMPMKLPPMPRGPTPSPSVQALRPAPFVIMPPRQLAPMPMMPRPSAANFAPPPSFSPPPSFRPPPSFVAPPSFAPPPSPAAMPAPMAPMAPIAPAGAGGGGMAPRGGSFGSKLPSPPGR